MPLTRLGHVLVLLELLKRHPRGASRAVIRSELLDSYGSGPATEETFKRYLNRDLLPLRHRGLIGGPDGGPYKLRYRGKDERWRLERSEHQAIQALWGTTPDPALRVLPPPALAEMVDPSDVRMERALGVLRLLEEQLDAPGLTIDDIVRRTRIRGREVRTALDDLREVEKYAGTDHGFTVELRSGRVSLAYEQVDGEPGVLGGGPLAQLGLFGYSLQETDHRLALIHSGLQTRPDDQDLMNAEAKLTAWREHLRKSFA